jgi:hypothetical protein
MVLRLSPPYSERGQKMILHPEIIIIIITTLLIVGIVYIIVKVVTALNKILRVLQRLEDESTKNKDKDSNA